MNFHLLWWVETPGPESTNTGNKNTGVCPKAWWTSFAEHIRSGFKSLLNLHIKNKREFEEILWGANDKFISRHVRQYCKILSRQLVNNNHQLTDNPDKIILRVWFKTKRKIQLNVHYLKKLYVTLVSIKQNNITPSSKYQSFWLQLNDKVCTLKVFFHCAK